MAKQIEIRHGHQTSTIATKHGDFTVSKKSICPYQQVTVFEATYHGSPTNGANRGMLVTICPWAKRADLFSVTSASNGCRWDLVLRMEEGGLVDASHRYHRGQIVPYKMHGMTFYRREPDTFDGAEVA